MDNTDIQKQLHFRCLTSQTQGNTKLNFASSQNLTIFAPVNQQLGLPRESAFSLFRRRELGHFTKVQSRNEVNDFSLVLYSYSAIYTKWSYISKPYLLCTKQKGVQALRLRLGEWMAPLSSLWLNRSEPRTNNKKMKNDWDSMLSIAQDAVKTGSVDAKLLKILLEQVTIDRDLLIDDEHRLVIQSLCSIDIDKKLVEQMSKNKTGRDLIVNFYEELQRKLPKEQQASLNDIFSEVTEWIKQQK